MELRNEVRPHVWHCLGNGESTSVWHELWCEAGPLDKFITRRQVYSAGFSHNATVASMVENGQLRFPDEWFEQYTVLNNRRQLVLIDDKEDVVKWKSKQGNLVKLSTNRVWQDMRSHEEEVPWSKVKASSSYSCACLYATWLVSVLVSEIVPVVFNLNLTNLLVDDNASWGWRKLMELRNEVRPHVWHCLGNGESTSVWHELWCEADPLDKFITRRQVYSAAFSHNATVASMVENGQLRFPDEWFEQLNNRRVA
ncbi:RNA-directed DNA polymerase, eukaryota, Reverse transcriptase zinc-binding domain protein [Artemisia annua]|uniref:RNA-directed DNA polymerase, eukaryota, Reverse transcriptase zinc-binding domain protein n=1 Tax=Artemisia annua TaxID=35608 RepID=A0A2U1QCD4_ARTAN|nr:RNA-directed DNA polymerase, eukaryota, Reverse transcriptase zinc-binding domain protein [Artemisia annua]